MENKEIIKKQIIDAFQFRHATKKFDETKKISDADFEFILETAWLSPSSIGIEPWQFLVIENEDIKNKLKQVTWGAQGQLPTASHYVVILARTIKDTKYNSDYIKNHLKTIKGISEELIPTIHEKYKKLQELDLNLLDSERTIFDGLVNKHTLL